MESFFPFQVEIEMQWHELEEKMKSLEGFELTERPPIFCYTQSGGEKLNRQSKAYADEKRAVAVLIGTPGEFRHTVCGPFEGVLEVAAILVGTSYEDFLESYEDARLELEIFEKKLGLEQRKKLRRGRELRV